jgi:hypothetical protein
MPLMIAIYLTVVGCLVALAVTKGFERTLPLFAFLVIMLPNEARIYFVDLFVLSATRVVVATLIVLYFVFGRRNRGSDRGRRLPMKYLLILYLGWCAVATVNSIVFITSLKTVIDNALEFYLVYYILAKSVSSVQTVHRILIASVAALVVCCAFGALEAYAHWKVSDLFPEVVHRLKAAVEGSPGTPSRIRSTFPNAILFGNALALGIPWVLYLLSLAKTAAQKVYLWAALIMMAWSLYKTVSRGPWLALALSLVVLYIFSFSQGSVRRNLAVFAFLTIAALIIRPGVRDTLKNTYVETLDPQSRRGASYQSRYELMRAGTHALAGNLGRSLWGFGPESFYYLGLEAKVPATGQLEVLESCDSAWVGVLVEMGYVGLFLVAALLTKAALISLEEFRTLPRPANILCLVFMINIGAFAFMMLSVANYQYGQQTYMLWTLIALSVVYPGLAKAENQAKNGAMLRDPSPVRA